MLARTILFICNGCFGLFYYYTDSRFIPFIFYPFNLINYLNSSVYMFLVVTKICYFFSKCNFWYNRVPQKYYYGHQSIINSRFAKFNVLIIRFLMIIDRKCSIKALYPMFLEIVSEWNECYLTHSICHLLPSPKKRLPISQSIVLIVWFICLFTHKLQLKIAILPMLWLPFINHIFYW